MFAPLIESGHVDFAVLDANALSPVPDHRSDCGPTARGSRSGPRPDACPDPSHSPRPEPDPSPGPGLNAVPRPSPDRAPSWEGLELQCRGTRLGPGAVHAPLVVVANYVFDSLPADVFRSGGGDAVLEEALVCEAADGEPAEADDGGRVLGLWGSGAPIAVPGGGPGPFLDPETTRQPNDAAARIPLPPSTPGGGPTEPTDARQTATRATSPASVSRPTAPAPGPGLGAVPQTRPRPDASPARPPRARSCRDIELVWRPSAWPPGACYRDPLLADVLRVCAETAGVHTIPVVAVHCLRALRGLLGPSGRLAVICGDAPAVRDEAQDEVCLVRRALRCRGERAGAGGVRVRPRPDGKGPWGAHPMDCNSNVAQSGTDRPHVDAAGLHPTNFFYFFGVFFVSHFLYTSKIRTCVADPEVRGV